MNEMEWVVRNDQESTRIDKYLHELNNELSRTQIQSWIKDANILVNNNQVKTNYKVQTDDVIHLQIPESVEETVEPENIDLDIIYEDDDVMVINKPRGMVVHPAPGHYTNTLVNALLYHCKELSRMDDPMRPGIVHRIDKDTTGLIMVAKNEEAHVSLVEQLRERTVKRFYKAIVHGFVSHQHGTINAPIGRDKKDRQSMTVTEENSRNAVTHFTVLECFNNFTYLECELETGRTHQIRVHMKYIDHPLAGDPKYGPRKKSLSINGQALHSYKLGFTHPRTGEEMNFEAPLPADMEKQLNYLRSL